jgi:hypothetical protein
MFVSSIKLGSMYANGAYNKEINLEWHLLTSQEIFFFGHHDQILNSQLYCPVYFNIILKFLFII